MSAPRYTVEEETISKSLLEDVVESFGLDTDEATRVIITDEQTGRRASGAAMTFDEAREIACRKLGISSGDLDDEVDE